MCYQTGTGQFAYLTHHDDSGGGVTCHLVSDVADVAKLAYYAARLLVLLGG